MTRASKLLIWTQIPTHHQSGFFAALRAQDIDLKVHYYSRVYEQRQLHGWATPEELPPGEHYIAPTLESLAECPDWRDRIHIVPGYATSFLVKLAATLSREGVPWLHWSEPSRSRPTSFLRYPIKRFYATLVNHRALGALAIGTCARRDFIRWGIDARKIRFLPYSIPVPPQPADAPGNSVQTGSHSLRFAFVGALCQRKGVDVLLHAFKQVHAVYPDARLEVVGYDESGGRYARLAEQLGLTSSVSFTGSVPAAQIATVFNRCDVFVLPSRFDGWGVVLNEAAALGRAIISTEDTGAAHHLIVPDRNGYRVPTGNANALAQAMFAYCEDPDLAAAHGEQSRQIFLRFTPERNAVRIRRAINSLLSRGGARQWDRARSSASH